MCICVSVELVYLCFPPPDSVHVAISTSSLKLVHHNFPLLLPTCTCWALCQQVTMQDECLKCTCIDDPVVFVVVLQCLYGV